MTESSPSPHLEGQALVDALKKQLEFYFSAKNLANDAYLTSHMNAQRYVPVDVIANFRKVKSLTEDRDLLVKVMRQCKNLACDEEGRMVRPTLKMERKTLLLRDIPQSTSEEEVRAIFDEHCGKVLSVHSDVGDTWYIEFETEEECVNTAMYLADKTFQGKPIRCRVKSENLLRGFFFHQGPPKESLNTQGYRGPVDGGFYNVPVGYAPFPSYPIPFNEPLQNHGYLPPQPQEFRGRGRRGRKGGYGGNPRRKKGQHRRQREAFQKGQRSAPPQLGPEHFPALPTNKKVSVGYSKPFRKYTREHLAEIVEELSRKEISRPECFPSKQECVVLRSSPNLTCQLLEPFPVMYPASPSPLLAAQPHHSCMPPFLDLATFDSLPLDTYDGSVLLQDPIAPASETQPQEVTQEDFESHSELPEVAVSEDAQPPKQVGTTQKADGKSQKAASQKVDIKYDGEKKEKKTVAAVVKAAEAAVIAKPKPQKPVVSEKPQQSPQKLKGKGSKPIEKPKPVEKPKPKPKPKVKPKPKAKPVQEPKSTSSSTKLSYADMARRAPQSPPAKKSQPK